MLNQRLVDFLEISKGYPRKAKWYLREIFFVEDWGMGLEDWGSLKVLKVLKYNNNPDLVVIFWW